MGKGTPSRQATRCGCTDESLGWSTRGWPPPPLVYSRVGGGAVISQYFFCRRNTRSDYCTTMRWSTYGIIGCTEQFRGAVIYKYRQVLSSILPLVSSRVVQVKYPVVSSRIRFLQVKYPVVSSYPLPTLSRMLFCFIWCFYELHR